MVDDFFDVGKMVQRPQVRDKSDNKLLFRSCVSMHNEQLKYTRAIYNLFDLLGDLGGVTEVIMIVFGFIFYSVSEHSFYLTASQKLFYAKTTQNDVF